MQNNKSFWDYLNSWPVIVGCFILGLWPLGLILIFCGDKIAAEGKRHAAKQQSPAGTASSPVMREVRPKTEGSIRTERRAETVREDPKQQKNRRSRVLAIVGTSLAGLGILMLAEPLGMMVDGFAVSAWLEDLWFSVSFMMAGGVLVGTHVGRVRRMKRYARYLTAMGEQESVSIRAFAERMGISHARASRELQRMVEEGYFSAGAYLDMGRDRLYRSGSAAAKEMQQESEKTARAQQATADEYESILRNIRRANDEIADEVLSRKIDRIEDITRKIFSEVERHPEKRRQINTLLNYYLPTTQKLLDCYAKFEAAGVEGENMGQAKQRIEGTMDRIVTAFEKQLDTLYSSDAMDVESDIRVMEQMLHWDSADTEKDFGLKL